jgi:hypothetical protein
MYWALGPIARPQGAYLILAARAPGQLENNSRRGSCCRRGTEDFGVQ